MALRENGLIGKGKGRRTRGSEIDILGLYGGARAGLLLGWLGVCRLPCLVLEISRFLDWRCDAVVRQAPDVHDLQRVGSSIEY